MKHNAAIYLLSSRILLLEKCLTNLFENWNYQYNYPVYVHYFNDIYSNKFIEKIKNKRIGNVNNGSTIEIILQATLISLNGQNIIVP